MLEGVQVDLPSVQGVVGQGVLGELDQLHLNVLRGQKLVDGVPLLVVGAHHAYGDHGGLGGGSTAGVRAGGGAGARIGAGGGASARASAVSAAGGQRQGQGRGQRER